MERWRQWCTGGLRLLDRFVQPGDNADFCPILGTAGSLYRLALLSAGGHGQEADLNDYLTAQRWIEGHRPAEGNDGGYEIRKSEWGLTAWWQNSPTHSDSVQAEDPPKNPPHDYFQNGPQEPEARYSARLRLREARALIAKINEDKAERSDS